MGRRIADRDHFAENQSSLEALTTNILASLDKAVGLIAIMHPRGVVTFPDNRQHIRASVWIEQEIAIVAYLTQILKRPLKIAPYIHREILREGMRDQLLLNAVPFATGSEVLDHLCTFLPSWKELPLSLKTSSPPKLRVAIEHGHFSNFLLKYTNDDDEPVFIRETRLFSGNIELTEPLTPDEANPWKVAAHTSTSFRKTLIQYKSPAANLVKMNLRLNRDLSQERLVELCGYETNQIGRIERAERTVSFEGIMRIFFGLSMPPAELFKLIPTIKRLPRKGEYSGKKRAALKKHRSNGPNGTF